MQLVENNKLQHRFPFSYVTLPQRHISLLHQAIVQHFKVGKQNVRYGIYDGIAVFYDVVFTHHGWEFLLIHSLTDKQSGCNLPA